MLTGTVRAGQRGGGVGGGDAAVGGGAGAGGVDAAAAGEVGAAWVAAVVGDEGRRERGAGGVADAAAARVPPLPPARRVPLRGPGAAEGAEQRPEEEEPVATLPKLPREVVQRLLRIVAHALEGEQVGVEEEEKEEAVYAALQLLAVSGVGELTGLLSSEHVDAVRAVVDGRMTDDDDEDDEETSVPPPPPGLLSARGRARQGVAFIPPRTLLCPCCQRLHRCPPPPRPRLPLAPQSTGSSTCPLGR